MASYRSPTSNARAKDHAVVMVGAPLPPAAEQRARQAIAEHGGQPEAMRWLSAGKALELGCSLAPEQADSLTQALWTALPGVDLAIVPQAQRRKRLLCADMDATMVVGETIEFMADALGKRAIVAEITERAMRGEIDFTQALVERVRMLRDLEVARLTEIARGLQYQLGAWRLVNTMKRQAGAHTLLVSGGFSLIAEHVRKELGFDVQVSNQLGLAGNQRLSGTVHLPVVDSERKLELFQAALQTHDIPQAASFAIGDGANDLPMIKAASMGVAYKAKPIVRQATRYQINHTSLVTALYYQGYDDNEIITRTSG